MNTNTATIPIPIKFLEQIEKIAKENHCDKSEVVEIIMDDYFSKTQNIAKLRNNPDKEKELLRKLASEQKEEILENLEYQVDLWNEDNFTE